MLPLSMKGHFRLVVNREKNFYFIDFIHRPDYFSKLYRFVTLSRPLGKIAALKVNASAMTKLP